MKMGRYKSSKPELLISGIRNIYPHKLFGNDFLMKYYFITYFTVFGYLVKWITFMVVYIFRMLKGSRDSDTEVLRAPLRATDNERNRERKRNMVIIIYHETR